jgi:hypothetical protein
MNFDVKFSDLTIGCDPEYAAGAIDMHGDMEVIPAAFFRLARGIKFVDHPRHPLFFESPELKIIEDGAAFEFTVPPAPNGNWEQLLGRVYNGLEILKEMLSKFPSDTIGPVVRPTLKYNFDRWNSMGPEMEMANMFGCDPDENAFDTSYTSPEIDASIHPYRYFGGHIHWSGHPLFEIAPRTAIRGFAMGIGLAATAYSPFPELERLRTYLYGRIGKFRPQKYGEVNGKNLVGVEYRTPSTSWTNPDYPDLPKEIFRWAKFSVENLLNFPEKIEKFSKELEVEMTDAIAQCNQTKALELLSYIESKV